MIKAIEEAITNTLLTAGFNAYRGRMRPFAASELPAVVVWTAQIRPEIDGSAGRTVFQETAQLHIDVYAHVSDYADVPADEGAYEQLVSLCEQIRAVLFHLSNVDLGFAPGTIARVGTPLWQTYQTDTGAMETVIVGGRWTMEVSYCWTPGEDIHPSLDKIAASIGRFEADITYGG